MKSSRSQPVPIKTVVMLFIVFAGALLMNLVPAWELVVTGPFRWHVAQPQSWQGGIEALVLCVFVAGGFFANRRWGLLVLVLVPVALYARRHAFDLALVIDLAYLEIMVALGFRIQLWLARPTPCNAMDYVQAFTTGFIGWSLCAWTASALDLGSIQQLRWLTLGLALLSVLGPHRPPTLCQFLLQRMRTSPQSVRIWCGVLATWLLVLFARSKVALGYDDRWYGLQAEHVLVPNHSIFEPLGLVSPVHYYPKLYEMWLLPLSSTGDSSVLSGMTILFALLLLIVSRQLMRDAELGGALKFPVLALIATLPAFANAAVEPKPDVVAIFFILLTAVAAASFARKPSLDAACWLAIGAALACASKLTAIPYAGTLLLLTGLSGWRRQSRARSEPNFAFQTGLLTALLTLPLVGFVVARTWLLAGMPTIGPDPLFKLWQSFGFKLREPAGTLAWAQPQDWADVPQLLLDALFRPQVLPHVVITWTGNVWVWFAIISLCAALFTRIRVPGGPIAGRMPMITLALLAAVLAIGIRYLVRGGDGNYFLFGLIPAIILTAASAYRQITRSPTLMRGVLACIPAFVLFQAGYSFISGSWVTGTRAMDANFSRPFKEMRSSYARQLEYYGLTEIANYLKRMPGHPRAVGLIEVPAIFLLPARYEDLALVSYSRSEYLENVAALLTFMHDQDICCIVLPAKKLETPMEPPFSAAWDVASILRGMSAGKVVVDRGYFMVDFSAATETDWLKTIALGQSGLKTVIKVSNRSEPKE